MPMEAASEIRDTPLGESFQVSKRQRRVHGDLHNQQEEEVAFASHLQSAGFSSA